MILTGFIKNDGDLNKFSHKLKPIVETIGFDAWEINKLLTSVYEIGNNGYKHASGAEVNVENLENKGLKITFIDTGKGISNVSKALENKYSTVAGSLGIGFTVAKNGVNRLEVKSVIDKGTIVILHKWLPLAHQEFNLSVISQPDRSQFINGDAYFSFQTSINSQIFGVIDGLGEGLNASRVALFVKQVIEKQKFMPINKIILKIDEELKQTKLESGATVLIGEYSPNRLKLCGVGDTFSELFLNNEHLSYYPKQGLVGLFRLPKIEVKEYPINYKSTLILCTDGITNRLLKSKLDFENTATELVHEVFYTHRREYGDATVMVVKLNPHNV